MKQISNSIQTANVNDMRIFVVLNAAKMTCEATKVPKRSESFSRKRRRKPNKQPEYETKTGPASVKSNTTRDGGGECYTDLQVQQRIKVSSQDPEADVSNNAAERNLLLKTNKRCKKQLTTELDHNQTHKVKEKKLSAVNSEDLNQEE